MYDRPKTDEIASEEILANLKTSAQHVEAQLLEKTGNAEFKFQLKCRQKLIAELQRRAEVLASQPKVFISYSREGQLYYERAREFFEKNDFRVVHWQNREERLGGKIVPDIVARIASCSCFLGIWSGQYRSERADGTDKKTPLTTPSVWMPFELGIAIANNAICQVFIDGTMHSDFMKEPNLGNYNERFNSDNFGALLTSAATHYKRELAERPPRWSATSPLDQEYG